MTQITDRWTAKVLTLFPDMFPGPLGASLAGKALAEGVWALETVDIRDYATDAHKTVDDAPWKIVTYRNLQAIAFEDLSGSRNRVRVRSGLPDQLDQGRRQRGPHPKPGETQHIRAFCAALLAGVHPQALSAEFHQDGTPCRAIANPGERLACRRPDQHQHVSRPVGFRMVGGVNQQRMGLRFFARERTALTVLFNDIAQHGQAPNILVSP